MKELYIDYYEYSKYIFFITQIHTIYKSTTLVFLFSKFEKKLANGIKWRFLQIDRDYYEYSKYIFLDFVFITQIYIQYTNRRHTICKVQLHIFLFF